MKKMQVIGMLVLVALLATAGVALAVAANFRAHLNGRNEVPPAGVTVVTLGQGQATFQLSEDGSELSYKLIASNIENIFMAHIHLAPAGANGPVVVWLYPAPDQQAPLPIPGRHDGVLAEGVIRAENLVGPLAGHPLSDLVAAIEAGNAYVNVHTNDFVAPTNTGPGDYPGGEIRGQIFGHTH
jgi:hypothetical protein